MKICRIAVGLVLLFMATEGVSATVMCQERKPPEQSGYWGWRLVEGRKCWYAGRARMSPMQLRWPAPEPNVAPPTPSIGKFEQTWRELLSDLTGDLWQRRVPVNEWKR
jgi:hypothetical protein